MADGRRITITKKVSLAGLADGWDDCYAIVTPADYRTYDELSQLDTSKLTKAEDIKYQMQVVKNHFVEGKIKVWGSDELVDMKDDDAEASVDFANLLYIEIMGMKLDPKDSGAGNADASTPNATTPSGEPQPNSEATTAITSSTASPKASPARSSEMSASSDTGNTSDSPTTTT